MRFGQIRRFPSRKQPIDDFRRNSALARAILLGQRFGPGFDINNVDSRIVRRGQTNAMLAQLAANVRGVPEVNNVRCALWRSIRKKGS
jgi:hypothetical protein